MQDKLVALIPEFNLIKDKKLREKVLAVWERAIKLGGWKVEDLSRMPFTLLIESSPITMVEHIRGVVQVAYKAEQALREVYGDKIKINHDHLIAGALLHDVGKMLEFAEENGNFKKSYYGRLLRHPFSGVALCYEEGIPPEVLHIIAVHSKEGEGAKRTTEAIILHHADFINFEWLK